MRKGYKITLSVLTIMILMTITVGTSYSYYSISDVQKDPNTLTSTCFNIEYKNESSSINLVNTYPMEDAKGLTLTPYEFTIENTCASGNQSVNYVVTLNTLTGSISGERTSTLTSNLKYRLDKIAPLAVQGTIGTLTTPYDLSANIKTEYGIDTSYNIESGVLAPGESKTFNLRLWIKEEADNSIMGQNFEGKVLVYSYL